MDVHSYEFRANMKKYLDMAIRGEQVSIVRGGVVFDILVRPAGVRLTQAKKAVISSSDVPRTKDNPSNEIEFCKHDQVKGLCRLGCR